MKSKDKKTNCEKGLNCTAPFCICYLIEEKNKKDATRNGKKV